MGGFVVSDPKEETMDTKKQIVLHPDKFDALELAAMEFGGVGAGMWWKDQDNGSVDYNCPICVNGLAVVAELPLEPFGFRDDMCPSDRADITTNQNDRTVESLIKQGRYTVGQDGIERVTWADFCEELNVVRGEEPVLAF
jgi:hypothetical protein